MSLVNRYPDARAAAQACAAEAMRLLRAAIHERGRAALAISGGSSPKLMFEYFARAAFDWSRVDVFWVDERCVPANDPQSNYKLAHDAWLKDVPAGRVHRVQTELGPERAAEAYAAELRPFLPLDVVHRGMGADAHTASLFPGDPLIHDVTALTGVAHREIPRVTLMPAVLEGARHTLILATGADKVEPLEAVLRTAYDALRYPAQIAALDGSKASWFIDEAAAARL